MYKKCEVCNRLYKLNTKWSLAKRKKSRWCSQKCYHSSWDDKRKSTISKIQKKYIKNETKEQRAARMKKVLDNRTKSGNWTPPNAGKIRDENYAWLGDRAKYNSKHKWIQKHWTKTGICENCNTATKPFGNRKYGTEWANLDGNYDRDDRSTWKELCVGCHRKLDNVV
jgi:chromosome segregation ATPase